MLSYEKIVSKLDEIKDVLDLNQDALERLKIPERIVEINYPIKMDNGDIKFFKGIRVHHSNPLGPVKGGTRLHPEVDIDEVKSLSFFMSIKNSLAGIPAGGAKGAIICDPMELSKSELKRVVKGYVRYMGAKVFGSKRDIPGPDMGCNQEVMSWMLDELELLKGYHDPASIASKRISIGGSKGRDTSTSQGVVTSCLKTLEKLDDNIEDKDIIIQGFGNLGFNAADIFNELNANIIAISDISGAVYNENGIDPVDLKNHMDKGNKLVNYSKAKKVDPDKMLEMQCDILLLAAVQNVVTKNNADKIKADILLEGANGPVTIDAEPILLGNDVFIVPDILANSGGAIVSYFEKVQNNYDFFWDYKTIQDNLNKIIKENFDKVYEMSLKNNITMRMACWSMAVERLNDAIVCRGRIT